MGKGLAFFAGLLIGAGVGGGAGFLITRKICDKRAEEEVASIKQSYRKAREEYLNNKKQREEEEKLYAKAQEALKRYSEKQADLQKTPQKPVVERISPMEFNEVDKKFANVEIFLYADNVYASKGQPPMTLDDIDRAFGSDMLQYLDDDLYGEGEGLYIRRFDNNTDYAIYYDGRTYAQAAAKEIKPLQN